MVPSDIGDRLREEIDRRGLQHKWVADRAGIPKETLSRIVTGATTSPGVDTIAAICRALGVTVSDLIGETRPPQEPTVYDRRPEFRELLANLEAVPPEVQVRVLEAFAAILDLARTVTEPQQAAAVKVRRPRPPRRPDVGAQQVGLMPDRGDIETGTPKRERERETAEGDVRKRN